VEHISIDVSDHDDEIDQEDAYEVILQCLEYFGYSPFALAEGGADIGSIDFTEVHSPCIVLGDDKHGLPAYLKERLPVISIMPTGIVRSVDTAAAAAIAMSHIHRQYVPAAGVFGI
jgi:tRNA G18 (ribose-2'-O)-methylase SpoU